MRVSADVAVKKGLLILAGGVAVVLVASGLGQWIPGDKSGEPAPSPGRVMVDVRNAGGVEGMGRAATNRLRAAGFDVVAFGNASAFDQDSSVVIDRVGSLRAAQEVAAALGIGRVESRPNPKLFVDVTVRLGADWRVPDPADEPDAGSGGLLSWLRGLVRAR